MFSKIKSYFDRIAQETELPPQLNKEEMRRLFRVVTKAELDQYPFYVEFRDNGEQAIVPNLNYRGPRTRQYENMLALMPPEWRVKFEKSREGLDATPAP